MGGETFEIEKLKLKSSYPKLSAGPTGKWISNIYKERIASFYSNGQYAGQNLRACVISALQRERG